MAQRIILLVIAAPIIVGVLFNLFFFVALFLFNISDSTVLRTILWIVAAVATFPLVAKMYKEQAESQKKFGNPSKDT